MVFHSTQRDIKGQKAILKTKFLKPADLRNVHIHIVTCQPPFILEGRNNEHLSSGKEKYPAEVAEIRDYLYVNDLITCGKNFEKVASLKDIVI